MAAAKKPAPKGVSSARARDAVRATFERKRDELKKLRTDGTKSWDRQWELVDDILTADPPLWSGHYKSEAAFIAGELPGETPRSVRRNVLVASAFSPSDEKAHGINKLEELALYLMARSGATAKLQAVDLARVVVRVPDGGRGFRQVRATEATIEEIRAARRVARGSAPKRKANPFERALRSALDASGALKGIAITASADSVRFGAIPRDQLVAFAKALAKAKLPKDVE